MDAPKQPQTQSNKPSSYNANQNKPYYNKTHKKSSNNYNNHNHQNNKSYNRMNENINPYMINNLLRQMQLIKLNQDIMMTEMEKYQKENQLLQYDINSLNKTTGGLNEQVNYIRHGLDKAIESIDILNNQLECEHDKEEYTEEEDEQGMNGEDEEELNDKIIEHINIKKKRGRNTKNITINTDGMLPLIFNKNSSNNNNNNLENEQYDSDEEYPESYQIYIDTAKLESKESDDNFCETPINSIDDLIELGSIYKPIKTEKKTKEKVSEQKNDNGKEDIENLIKTALLTSLFGSKINPIKKEHEEPIDTKPQIKHDMRKLYEYEGKKYSVNLETVSRLVKPLTKLKNLVGMKHVKEDIFDMIIYYLQGFETKNRNMLHSVIEGPPGVGKTKLGKILAQIYCGLGIIPTSKFKYVKATDLIGEHVGATRHMTQEIIDESNGGVLFIDEAYGLSNAESKDPYGKECLETLNMNLSENKNKLIVIIAGYPEHLDKYFFAANPGLQRRFPFRFRIDGYNHEELRDIFIDKIKRSEWLCSSTSLNLETMTQFFKNNFEYFTNFGGDIENFFKSCQFSHSRRTMGLHSNNRGILTLEDLNNGLNKFIKNRKTEKKVYQLGMYI